MSHHQLGYPWPSLTIPPIVHCVWQIFGARSRIGTELQYVGSSWSSFAFARPCEGVHRSTSLMSSSLLIQQCPVCLVRLIVIVSVMDGRWLYSCCFAGAASWACLILLAAFLCNCCQAFKYIYIYIYIYICVCVCVCVCVNKLYKNVFPKSRKCFDNIQEKKNSYFTALCRVYWLNFHKFNVYLILTWDVGKNYHERMKKCWTFPVEFIKDLHEEGAEAEGRSFKNKYFHHNQVWYQILV